MKRFASAATPRPGRAPRVVLALAVAIAVVGGSIGCSPRSRVLARVGNRTITVSDFMEVAGRAGTMYGVSPDSAKRALLEDLVKRALMLEAARRTAVGNDEAIRDYRRVVQDQVLTQAMVERLVPRTVPVSEGEARELYERRGYETHLQVILSFDQNLAEAARTELARGQEFGGVADRFNPAGLLPPHGDLGFVTAGTLPTPLDDFLVEGSPGAIVGPVQGNDQAWYVTRVLARRKRAQEPFEQQALTLVEILMQRKRRALSNRAFVRLRESYQLRVEPGAPQLLFARFNAPTGQEPPAETLDPTQVLAHYRTAAGRDTTYKLREAENDLDSGQGERPNPSVLPSVEQWIESRVMHRIVYQEALRRGLDQEPAIAQLIRDKVESQVLDAFYDSEVAQRAHATDADLQAALLQQPSAARLESATLQHLTLPDSASAVQLIEHVRTAPSMKDAILLSSPRLQVVEETISFPSRDPIWSMIEPALARLSPGALIGPIPVPGGGWRVVQIRSVQRAAPSLATLSPDLQQAIHMQADNLARERRLVEYTDSLRQSLPLSVDLDELRRVRWPAGARVTG